MNHSTLLLVAMLSSTVWSGAQESPEIHGGAASWGGDQAATRSLIEIPERAAVRAAPSHEAELITVLEAGRVPLLESRGRWVRIEVAGHEGWIDLDAERPTVEISELRDRVSSVPLPPLDLPVRAQLGPYRLFADEEQADLQARLATLATEHLALYAERYGIESLAPSGEGPNHRLGGDVAVFSSIESYQEFLARHNQANLPIEGHHQAFFRAPDRVVIIRGSRSIREVSASFVHELTHLRNWHSFVLGGARTEGLPVWLEEGLAEDLALAGISQRNKLSVGRLDRDNLRYGRRLGLLLDEVDLRIRKQQAPSLDSLIGMTKESFWQGEINTLTAALWVRFFLDDSTGWRQLFLGWLSALVSDPRTVPLAEALGTSPTELERPFREWLVRHRDHYFDQ